MEISTERIIVLKLFHVVIPPHVRNQVLGRRLDDDRHVLPDPNRVLP